MLKDLCKRFSKDTYADKKERVLYDNCLCKILYTLVSELSVIPQGTVYHRCLYNFLSDSIVNIPGKIAASRTGVSLQARSIELIKNFQACWPVKDHDLFLVHSKIILDLAESLINKVETNPVGQDLIKTTIKQIADHIEEHFTDLTNDQLQKLTDHVANALKTVKKNFKEQLYNRILVQALNRLLSGQKKGALNHLFLGKLFVLTCEIKASDAFISNLLIYTLLTIKQELKKDNPHIACLVNMILAGPQRLFRNILTSNVINEESDVKKYAYIFSEYVSLLTDLSFKLSNLGEPNPIKPFLDLLREAKVGK